MRQKRTRLIVAQSLVTAILLGVIALTILRSDHQNKLFAVGVPGTPGPVVERAPSYESAGGTVDRQRQDEDTGGNASGEPALGFTGPAAGTAGAGATAPGNVGPAATSPADPGEDGDDSPDPPGQQYDDTLARLSDAVQ